MKHIAAAVLLTLSTASIAADTYTQGYTKRDGTYVQPHYSTAPNDTRTDNYGSRGNTNPYTGREGTADPYSTPAPRHDSNSYNTTPRRPKSGYGY